MDTQANEQQLTPEESYVKGYTEAHTAYGIVLLAVAVACAAGIFVAAMFDVIVGMCVAICGTIGYAFFASDEIYRRIGIRHKHIRGNVHITEASVAYGSTLIIPSRLAYADVTEICDGAFDNEKNAELCCVYIPKSITRLGSRIFGENAHPSEIRYEGSKEEWEKIVGSSELSCISVCFDTAMPTIPSKKKKGKKDTEADK